MDRYNRQHIPGSACAVCNEDSKKNIMPRLPKDIEIVLVATSMAFLGSRDILVTEKDTGTVRRIVNGIILAQPLLDVNLWP